VPSMWNASAGRNPPRRSAISKRLWPVMLSPKMVWYEDLFGNPDNGKLKRSELMRLHLIIVVAALVMSTTQAEARGRMSRQQYYSPYYYNTTPTYNTVTPV